ncbi:MAG: hypothetical protein KDN05_23290 [Verrucomicrobiae bacterium]|nr:hypothetical protein [Verrucomicrobiae bacterium]MCP5533852.1 hypothetical protein [Akkermansiaceae bacterium]MCP5544918.1 hypothetical protein [Akkermansiaceae bacterium]
MRLLVFPIHEPLPGGVLHDMAAEVGGTESARRYRAVALTTLRQLRGLTDTRIRLACQPDDAEEAIRFWLLPKLADRWMQDDGVFRCDGWEIDFGGSDEEFEVVAEADLMCPGLGARWVHTALLGMERGRHRVRGPAEQGGDYFTATAHAAANEADETLLPALPVVRLAADWVSALDGPLGRSLKRAWEEEQR